MDESRIKMTILSQSMFISSSLRAVVALKVPDILKEHGMMSASEITALLPLRTNQFENAANIIDRIMHLLFMNGIFEKESGKYSLNSLSKYLIQEGNDESLVPSLLLFLSGKYYKAWECLPEAILEGAEPFRKAHGGNSVFDLGAEDPEVGRMFGEAMSNYTKKTMDMVLQVYDGFKNAKVLVDVGGSLGTSLFMINAKFPHVKCINFDLSHVVQQCIPRSGMENIGGDMFESVPRGDTILLKWILHDWNDERSIHILRNCYKSLESGGKVVIIESLHPDEATKSLQEKHIVMFDVAMLVTNPGGKERKLAEFEKLSKAAGFSKLFLIATVEVTSIMELYKSEEISPKAVDLGKLTPAVAYLDAKLASFEEKLEALREELLKTEENRILKIEEKEKVGDVYDKGAEVLRI